jgi:hypothetical protein
MGTHIPLVEVLKLRRKSVEAEGERRRRAEVEERGERFVLALAGLWTGWRGTRIKPMIRLTRMTKWFATGVKTLVTTWTKGSQ